MLNAAQHAAVPRFTAACQVMVTLRVAAVVKPELAVFLRWHAARRLTRAANREITSAVV